jgi:DNA-binding CsgD family transcriptional regulator/GAF domain-containing protein
MSQALAVVDNTLARVQYGFHGVILATTIQSLVGGIVRAVSHRDRKWILDVSERILCLKQVDEIRNTVLQQLEPILEAHKSNFFLAQGSDNRLIVRDVVARGIEEKYFDYFREYYYRMDPFINAINTLFFLLTNVCTTDQLVPYKNYVRTKYYNEFIRPQNIYAELVIYLTSETRLLGVASFFRPQNRPIFSEEDRVNARRVAPYLSAALEKALALEDVAQKDIAMKSILSEIPHKGVMLMDQHLEPVYVSESARNILSLLSQQSDGRKTAGFVIPAQIYLRLERCRKALLTKTRPDSEEQRFNLLTRDKAHSISADLRLVNIVQQRPFFVLMLESQAPALHLIQRLRETGLSKRETDVVLLVCEGLSNSQIAEKLFISEYTVVNHLRNIYAKKHVSNRTSLAHYVTTLLLRLPGAPIQPPPAPDATGCGNMSMSAQRESSPPLRCFIQHN